jgi:hypothetical protein
MALKHAVQMVNEIAGQRHEAHDFVPVADLDAYVADARTRWATVEVSPTPLEMKD